MVTSSKRILSREVCIHPLTGLSHRPILSLAYPTGLSYHMPILSQAYPIGLSYHRPIPRAYPMPQAYPVTGLAYHKPILSQAYPTGLSYHRPILILSQAYPYPITGLSFHRPILILSQAYPITGLSLSYHRPILSQAYPTCFIQVNSAAHVSTTRPVQHSKLETFQALNNILLTMATRAPPQPIVQEERQTERQA